MYISTYIHTTTSIYVYLHIYPHHNHHICIYLSTYIYTTTIIYISLHIPLQLHHHIHLRRLTHLQNCVLLILYISPSKSVILNRLDYINLFAVFFITKTLATKQLVPLSSKKIQELSLTLK